MEQNGNIETSAPAPTRRQKVVLASIAASLVIGALALVFLMATGVFQKIFMKEVAPKIGASAPGFALKDIEGRTVQLSQFHGKNPVFLNFWASWCPACRQEAPENERLHKLMAPKGLKLLAVSIDRGPTALADVKNFTKELKWTFIPLVVPTQQVLDLYGVTAIPTTFLIDRKGIIVAKEVGPRNWTSPERIAEIENLFN